MENEIKQEAPNVLNTPTDKENAPVAHSAQDKKKDKPKGKRGRPALITDKAFVEVHKKSKSLSEIVQTFALLRAMPMDKAKLYVSMRSSALRKKRFELKMFPRGRPKGSVNSKKVKSNLPEDNSKKLLATIQEEIPELVVKALDDSSASRNEARELMKSSVRAAPMPDPAAEFVDTPEGRENDGMCDWIENPSDSPVALD